MRYPQLKTGHTFPNSDRKDLHVQYKSQLENFFKRLYSNRPLAKFYCTLGEHAFLRGRGKKIWEPYFWKSIEVDVMGGGLSALVCALLSRGYQRLIIPVLHRSLRIALHQKNHDSFTYSYVLSKTVLYALDFGDHKAAIQAFGRLTDEFYNPWFSAVYPAFRIFCSGKSMKRAVDYVILQSKSGMLWGLAEGYPPQVLFERGESVTDFCDFLERARRHCSRAAAQRLQEYMEEIRESFLLRQKREVELFGWSPGHEYCWLNCLDRIERLRQEKKEVTSDSNQPTTGYCCRT